MTTALPNAEVWVHPFDGQDPTNADDEALYINDPSLKFKTLQAAIDAMQRHLASHYVVPYNLHQEGIVHALPGVYGPFNTALSSGDSLPITMRERVHVQGAGARQCLIRGPGTAAAPAPNTLNVLWPTAPLGPVGSGSSEVLVTYELSSPEDRVPSLTGPDQPPPWDATEPFFDVDNTAEALDGFTFIGGEVQVLVRMSGLSPVYWPAFRVSNCVFDLRHDWKAEAPYDLASASVGGPYFGILMTRRATCYVPNGTRVGYLDGRNLIAHNTFIFARWNALGVDGWESTSRDSTVGIMDVSNPNCSDANCADPDAVLKGIGNPCIVGNIFRTRPQASGVDARPFAMLGVEQRDTLVHDGAAFVQTNLFDPARVGATNAGTNGVGFYSLPVSTTFVESVSSNGWGDLWNCWAGSPGSCSTGLPSVCAASTNPVPAEGLALWDGATGVDPAFVGEYAATTLNATHSTLVGYRDWRVLPGSPVEDRGVVPTERYFHTPAGSFNFWTNEPPELDFFKWDGERWGNPRVVGGAPDVGFDERHLMIEAGNWANESNSHNVPGFMNPVGNGISTRYFILPTDAAGITLFGSNRWLRLHDTSIEPPAPSAGDGWVTPPGALLNPPSMASLPVDYRTKYLSYVTTSLTPIELNNAALQPTWNPIGLAGQSIQFLRVHWFDLECNPDCKHSYFNLQGLIVDDPAVPTGVPLPGELLRSNMQGEYR